MGSRGHRHASTKAFFLFRLCCILNIESPLLLNMNRSTGNIIIKIMMIFIAYYYHLELWQVDLEHHH